MKERQFRLCTLCNKYPALVSRDVCHACIGKGCDDKPHDGDPCVRCGYKRIYGQGDDVGECYREDVHGIEHQAQLAAYSMRRALCRADIAEGYGVNTESLEIINEILGVAGVEYKIVKI